MLGVPTGRIAALARMEAGSRWTQTAQQRPITLFPAFASRRLSSSPYFKSSAPSKSTPGKLNDAHELNDSQIPFSADSSNTAIKGTPIPTTPLLSPHVSPQRSSTRLQAYAPRLTAISRQTGVPFASLAGAFLVLHEITAIVPVVLLFFVFQALGAGAGIVAWMSDLGHKVEHVVFEDNGDTVQGGKKGGWKMWIKGWMVEAEEKAEKVGKRYGILGYEKVIKPKKGEKVIVLPENEETSAESGSVSAGGAAEKVANAIAAYVVVKALLPLRIGLSLALAPSFARFALYPIRRLMGRIKPKSKAPIKNNIP